MRGVRVDRESEQQLVSNGDDLDFHDLPRENPAILLNVEGE